MLETKGTQNWGNVILKLQHDQIDFRLLTTFETPVTFNKYDPLFS